MRPDAPRPGLIFDIARHAGLRFRDEGTKRPTRCPFHDDKHASAFLSSNNVFFCSACTPSGGWSAKAFAEALGVPWPPPDAFGQPVRGQRDSDQSKHEDPFPPTLARTVWRLAAARARDDDQVDADHAVYDFVARRGIAESWESRLFGILSIDMDLPASISRWPSTGHRLIAPLYDADGEIENVQARAVGSQRPKTLFPTGSRAAGTLFASASGVEVLRGAWHGTKRVILGEGLTDYLALATVSPIPVLCAPGTSMAASGIGPWIAGYEAFLAPDWDEAGANALDPMAANARRLGARQVRRLEWPVNAKDACNVVEQIGLKGLADFLRRALAEIGR